MKDNLEKKINNLMKKPYHTRIQYDSEFRGHIAQLAKERKLDIDNDPYIIQKRKDFYNREL